jgi:hypothetical protein
MDVLTFLSVLNAMVKLLPENVSISMLVCQPTWNKSAPIERGLKKLYYRLLLKPLSITPVV